MPTSSTTKKHLLPRGVRIALKIVITLVVAALVNMAITFALEPYGTKSQVAWTEYAQESELDTIVFGTSLTEYGVDPNLLVQDGGMKAYNLSTPNQSLEESFVGIRTAYDQHKVKRVILGLSCTVLTNDTPPNPQSAFIRFRAPFVSAADNAATVWELLFNDGAYTTESSINALFPWIVNHTAPTFEAISQNIEDKLNHADMIEVAERLQKNWHYKGLGYGVSSTTLNYNSAKVRPFTEGGGEEEEANGSENADIAPDRAKTLAAICDYCNENGIELIVVSTPLPVYNYVDPESTYFETMDQAAKLLEQHGIKLYDFNRAKPELFDTQEDYFKDSSHLNEKGGAAFTESLIKLIGAIEAGEDTDALFRTAEESIAAIDYVSAIFVTDKVKADGVHVESRAIAAPQVNVEYQLCVQAEGSEEWTVLVDYSPESSFVFTPDEEGLFSYRVSARKAGTDVEYDRYRVMTDLY